MTGYIGSIVTNLPEPYLDINFLYRPPQWKVAQHIHPYFQMLLVIDGCVEITCDYQTLELKKGQLCITPPKHTHALSTHGGYSQFGINLYAHNDRRGIIQLLQAHIEKTFVLYRPDLLEFIPQLSRECKTLSNFSRVKTASICDQILLSCLERHPWQQKTSFKDQLLFILNRDLSARLTLAGISAEMSLSQTQLERLCSKEFGCGVIELFNRLKTDKASFLLLDRRKSIEEISDNLGFCDQAYFSKFFKARTKFTPHQYRKHVNT